MMLMLTFMLGCVGSFCLGFWACRMLLAPRLRGVRTAIQDALDTIEAAQERNRQIMEGACRRKEQGHATED
jgi:hypothetical protein